MTQYLRRLTETGISQFRVYLENLKQDGTIEPPRYLLNDKYFSEAITNAPIVENLHFKLKREAAAYLVDLLHQVDTPDLMKDFGLWSWLSLNYFDEVCPTGSDGNKLPKAGPHYILDPSDYTRVYRHLLRTPYNILKVMPDHNRIFLDQPLDTHGEIIEQTISKLYLIRLKPVREIVDRLYIDRSTGKIKKGLFNKKESAKPGDLRNRLPTRLKQLKKTYDLPGLSADNLLELLGGEFQIWNN